MILLLYWKYLFWCIWHLLVWQTTLNAFPLLSLTLLWSPGLLEWKCFTSLKLGLGVLLSIQNLCTNCQQSIFFNFNYFWCLIFSEIKVVTTTQSWLNTCASSLWRMRKSVGFSPTLLGAGLMSLKASSLLRYFWTCLREQLSSSLTFVSDTVLGNFFIFALFRSMLNSWSLVFATVSLRKDAVSAKYFFKFAVHRLSKSAASLRSI